jgi:alkylhydroperoxidase family enzyme
LARRLGATDEQLAGLSRGETDAFPPEWSSALKVAELMTKQGGNVPGEEYGTLATYWSAEQVVEIVAVIGLFNYFNRFAIALDIPPTK